MFFGVVGVQFKDEFQHLCLCVVRQVPTRATSLLLIQGFILTLNVVKIAPVRNDSWQHAYSCLGGKLWGFLMKTTTIYQSLININ